VSVSQPPYTPLGYQVGPPVPPILPPTNGGQEAPDSLARRIDAAIASVPTDKRGTFIALADLSRTSIAVMVRAGDNVSFLGRVVKPWHGPVEAEAMIRVNFAAAVVAPTPLPPLQIGWGDYYQALRTERDGLKRNSRFRAFVKAFALDKFKAHPYLDGGRWFDRG